MIRIEHDSNGWLCLNLRSDNLSFNRTKNSFMISIRELLMHTNIHLELDEVEQLRQYLNYLKLEGLLGPNEKEDLTDLEILNGLPAGSF